MRILYLNPIGQLGGAETSLLTLLESLKALRPDWEYFLLVGTEGLFAEKARALGVKVELLPFPHSISGLGESGKGLNPVQICKSVGAVIRYVFRLGQKIREIQPSLIHTNGIKMHLLAALSRAGSIPIICHIHDYVSSRALTSHLMKALAGRFAAVVANSEDVARDCRAWARPSTPVYCVYNAVDLSRFSPAGNQSDLDSLAGAKAPEPGTLRVGLLATFARWKGHETFLHAIARFPSDLKARFYIIGGPIYHTGGSQHTREELLELAKTLNIADRIFFTGFVEDTPSAIRGLDLLVHASTKPEPFGMVIIEAMACERATIVARAGGAAELFIEGETGLGHEAGNAASLAQAMELAIRNEQLRRRIAVKSRQECLRRFAAPLMGKAFQEIYERHVSNSSSGNPVYEEMEAISK
jgi:glycosyltransferase involved in cell wall biosynthesis